ncbi:MAG: glycosyltransferase family 2 protein, partial [Planctomycetota bacterium]
MPNTVQEYLRRLKENPLDKSALLDCVALLKEQGDINYAWKLAFFYCSQKTDDVEVSETLRELEKIRMTNEHFGTKLSFIYIVLNGMPFFEYSLKSIYDFAHEIIIVEGAVDKCMFAANPDGSSKDGTVEFIRSFPDTEKKIKFIQGQWPEKCEMTDEALKYVTGDYVWLIADDEVYRKEDLQKILELLRANPGVTQIDLIPYNFWKGLEYIFESEKFSDEGYQYPGPIKYLKGSQFINHRPVQLKYPDYVFTANKLNRIDGTETKELGIHLFHYSYVLNEQVAQKIRFYHNRGSGTGWGIDLAKWYNECYLKWTVSNRKQIEAQYPVWTGDINSQTLPFEGSHPQVMIEYIVQRSIINRNTSTPQLVM